MYERFTDRARKVMQLANQEAQRFNHEYIGSEHILLGLVKEGSSVAANVLKNLDIDLRKIRLEVEKIIGSGPDMVIMGRLPQTPRAKKVAEYAIEEAKNLNHNYVGTEHLLLGLLREQEGVAAQVLMNLGLKLEDVRKEVLQLLGYEIASEESASGRELCAACSNRAGIMRERRREVATVHHREPPGRLRVPSRFDLCNSNSGTCALCWCSGGYARRCSALRFDGCRDRLACGRTCGRAWLAAVGRPGRWWRGCSPRLYAPVE